jgi:hypothetical protein
LGIAVVDQSVLERAVTDSTFGPRRWFEGDYGQEQNLDGITQRDLLNLDPAKIDNDLQLVAEVLAGNGVFFNDAGYTADAARQIFAAAGAQSVRPVVEALDQHYLQTHEYPRDDASFQRIVGDSFARILDPWLRPFYTRFSIERENAVLKFISSGPDKKPGTPDDFTVLTVKRKWFVDNESKMRDLLGHSIDYPASPEQFIGLIETAGIHFDELRDPWGSAMRVKVVHLRRSRAISIVSAGPDRTFGTHDDFTVAEFDGSFFSAMEAKIDGILKSAPEIPATAEAFRALLLESGVDLDSLRDPWGHRYYPAVRAEESFTDDLQIYTTRMLEIRSTGADGIKGDYGDFAVATCSRILKTTPIPQVKEGSLARPNGTGIVLGVVSDPVGAAVADARVKLNDLYTNDSYTRQTDQNGKFVFSGLPAGKYWLYCEAQGFRRSEIRDVPVADAQMFRADVMLSVGQTTQTVTVEAAAVPMKTTAAKAIPQVVASTALSTPRVRQYFPETLYWQPELVTDSAGHASVRVKLADSVTTWHVAVIGSTLDGRIAEGSTDIRAFQPFQVDLDVPKVLTAGDEISLPMPVRNYLEKEQKVVVSAKLAPELRMIEPIRQPGVVTPSSSANAVLTLRAEGPVKAAPVRVTAVGGSASDAIEKPVGIHPDGERRATAVNAIVESGRPLSLTVPADAIAGGIQGEVKIYPSLLARILESMEVLLERPWGCGEQTISSTYPNLLLLKALKEAGLTDEPLAARAMKNLQAGYQRLLRYQDSGGGFTYWGRGDADVALTAYALTFLDDASAFIPVDEDRVTQARQWLAKQNAAEVAANALRMHALAHTHLKDSTDLDRQLGELARKAAEFGDPYSMAAYALAAMEANKPELAGPVVEQLGRMAQDERGAAYWALRANTPYHGWGRSGQVETTALVVSALARWRKAGHGDAALNTLIDRGALFLLQNAEAGGAWGTSQATTRALMALLESWTSDNSAKAAQVEIRVNGVSGGMVLLPAGRAARAPLRLDISRLLRPGANEITLTGFESRAQQVQLTAAWYQPWGPKRPAKDLDIQVRYNTLTAAINDPVICDVTISRPSFRGYGMMIAEVGLPPGAEVDRGVLEDLIDDPNNGVDSYEVEPDHVTFYVWPRAADVKFHFMFRPRYSMKALAAQSVLYDYYNPDARVVLPPEHFLVGQ